MAFVHQTAEQLHICSLECRGGGLDPHIFGDDVTCPAQRDSVAARFKIRQRRIAKRRHAKRRPRLRALFDAAVVHPLRELAAASRVDNEKAVPGRQAAAPVPKITAVDLKRCRRFPDGADHMVHDPALQPDELVLDPLRQPREIGGRQRVNAMRAEQRAKKRHAESGGRGHSGARRHCRINRHIDTSAGRSCLRDHRDGSGNIGKPVARLDVQKPHRRGTEPGRMAMNGIIIA